MGFGISNGHVVYQRGADSEVPYWRKVHAAAVSEAGQIGTLYSGQKVAQKYEVAGGNLLSLAKIEREKEMALIRAAGFDINDSDDITVFIKKFNEIMMGVEQFEYATKRLKEALKTEHQDKKYRAPTIASWFTSYLSSSLVAGLEEFAGNAQSLVDIDFSVWTTRLEDIVDNAIKQALKNSLTKVQAEQDKEQYGDSEQWQAVYEASRSIQNFDQYFVNMVRSKIDFSRLLHIFEDESINLKNKKKKGFSSFINSEKGLNFQNGYKSRAIGGSVQEYIMSVLNSMGQAMQAAGSSGGRVLTSEKLKTDVVHLFSFSADINTKRAMQEVADQLNETLEFSTSLVSAASLMEDFYNQHLSKLDDSFIVYGSTKSYALTESFSGFSGTRNGSFEYAAEVLQEAGIGNTGQKVKSFINAAYNTAEGAILQHRREEIQEEMRIALMEAAAFLLFDDWVTIGKDNKKKGARAIHTLQLEGVNIPLSVLLEATGNAMTTSAGQMNALVKVSVNLPTSYLYPDPIKTSSFEVIRAAWQEQANTAKAESNFSMRFLVNFKSIIKKWLQ